MKKRRQNAFFNVYSIVFLFLKVIDRAYDRNLKHNLLVIVYKKNYVTLFCSLFLIKIYDIYVPAQIFKFFKIICILSHPWVRTIGSYKIVSL